MKTTSTLLVLALTLVTFVPVANAQYSLVWSDEFNGTALDLTKWGYDFGTGCPDLCGWGNAELQYYDSANVEVESGNLVITAREEFRGGRQYTSGKITTRGKHSWLYGRMEMRAKLPSGGGMWPAFWMMPEDDAYGGWAASGELDIMESSNEMDYIAGTIHYGGTFPQNTFTGGSYAPGNVDFSDDFRVYAVEWDPDEIRWYVDDVLYSTKTSNQWYTNAAPGNPRAPFDQDFHLILNAAVGGNYTGCTTPACITASFPQEFVIDYVRVYAENVDNALPTVSIVSPRSGGTIPRGDVMIEVDADDPDGSVARVEFYDDYDLLGEDTTAPFEFLWQGVFDGCYRIRARVIDDEGGTNEVVSDITVGSGCGQGPYAGNFTVLPGRVEMENYDEGGPFVAYEDSDVSNNGGVYRPDEAVDLEACSDVGGGFNLGWVRPGEWVEYTLVAAQTGTYDMRARIASQTQGGSFRLEIDGVDRTGTVQVPVTGGWQDWVDVDFTADIDAGPHVVRFVPLDGEFNINWFEATSVVATSAPSDAGRVAIERLESYPNPFNPRTTIRFALDGARTIDLMIFDAAGRVVRTLTSGEALTSGVHQRVWNGLDDGGAPVAGGIYFARLRAGDASKSVRLVLLK